MDLKIKAKNMNYVDSKLICEYKRCLKGMLLKYEIRNILPHVLASEGAESTTKTEMMH